ncbi:S-layer homology domain-containing protein [Pseudoflavonifractor capillosus]|uniref:S-layer homology domain-containing protein n=1 Tax=Pseudoflavonifractor capillosus TaxID=106588 RepID=UPI0019569534|nr:S-layer homology domain-containing protein [Pseudoflavonifractor capillosus]MBM6681626.1 S-layer homology domain-containing protein [Pseudoflavonifractor capillosus]
MGKKILSLCMALVLCLSQLPVTALATGEHDSHSNNWTEFTAGSTTLSGGSYYLSGDVVYSGTEITVSGEVILCLNGHKLNLNKQHISVGSGASLTLCDCSTGGVLTGGSGSKGGGVYVGGGGTFTMTGGSIAGNTAESGGGVYVDEGGTFTMEDGSINNNQVTSGGGGGVMVNKGSFTLSGGSITGNATSDATYGYGGGVCLYDTFNLSGDAIIQNNTKAGATDNLYLGWNTIKITGPLGENARIGVTADGVPRSFISGWSDNMAGENPADYFSSDGDALGIGLNADGNVVLGSLCTTITLNPNGGTLPAYSLVVGAALPIPTKTGYTFAGWYENQEFSGNPVTDIPTNNTENLNFYAKWTVNTYTISADVTPAYAGNVTVNGSDTSTTVVAGTEVTLSATANSGYHFVAWVENGQTVSSNNPYTFTVNSSHTLNAKFERLYTVTVGSTAGGTATGGGTYTEGDTVTLTATPDSGYHFDGWRVVSGSVTIQDNKFTMPAGNVEIQAIFDRNSSGGSSTPTKTPSQQAVDKIESAKNGSTVEIKLSTGSTKLDKEVFEELAGRDVTLEISLSNGVTWTVNGQDIPENADLTDLDLGVTLDASTISVSVVNTITGAVDTIQISLKHDGEFGFTMTLSAPLGKTNAGYWANLYYYNEDSRALEFQSADKIASDGTAEFAFSHASDYAIVIDTDSHEPVELPFTDVPEGYWAYDAIQYVYGEGLMAGTSGSTFSPESTTTRGQIVTILWRLSGSPVVNYLMDFDDVDPAAYYAEAIRWATSEGIAGGYGGGVFGPDDPITREQLAVMLHRYAQHEGYDVSIGEDTNILSYADAFTVSEYAVSALQWACGAGIISGTGDGSTLTPQGEATRAQAATVLMRFCEEYVTL